MNDRMKNYKVVTRSFKGVETSYCDTPEEVWDAIGRMSFGGIYTVTSPADLPTDEFVPL